MKIDKYLDFISESKLELLLEATIIYSNNFKKVLKEIDSPIATKLLRYVNDDKDIKRNYIDIDLDKEDMVSFIDQNKIDKEPILIYPGGLYEILSERVWEQENNSSFLPPGNNIPGQIIKVLTLDEICKLSPKGKGGWINMYNNLGDHIVLIEYDVKGTKYRGYFNKSGYKLNRDKLPRTSVSIGRFVKSFLPSLGETVDNVELEDFVDKFKKVRNIANNAFDRFKIVSGEDIRKYYLHSNYENQNGDLGGSCMRYDYCQPYLEIYVNNPDKIQLIIYLSENNKLIGRALLWTDTKGRKLMDRIYTSKTPDIQLFLEYAHRNKFYNKSSQDPYDTTPFLLNNVKLTEEVVIQLKAEDYKYYPFMDTFKYYMPPTGKLSNVYIDASMNLGGTDGYPLDEYDEYDDDDMDYGID